MRSLPFLVVCLLTACSPEDLSGFQPPARVNEIAHTVTTTFEDGTARLRVRRTLQNGSGEYEAVGHKFKLPEGAVATSLRIGSNGQWLAPGTLASSDDVETKWDLLRSLGTAAPSTIGKLAWEWDGSLQFELFGLAPNATVDIEYDVELPSSYAAGAVSFVYPLEEVELGWLPPSFPGLQSQQLESGLELRRAWTTRSSDADVRWATFPIDTNRNLWRLEVDVAAQLGELPKNANVVFVVDASISEGEKGVASQLELITPYLASVPDARVEVVVFRRYAERLFGRFVPASEFARELTMLAPERLAVGNGSNLDVGAQLAFDLLTHEGRLDLGRAGGNGRVVTFTDEQLKDALTVDALIGAMKQAPRDVVVHVVRRDESYGDSLSERRDDASRFARAAAVTGGIFLRVDGHPSDAVLDADVMRGLVRPIRIDDFAVVANDVATPP
ncbi:MAG: VWA domain-containing protein, partial [Archangium sp.]|nr:VWA domain-containing protein [Archangium sp.]